MYLSVLRWIVGNILQQREPLSFQDGLKENLDGVVCLNHERTPVSEQSPSEFRARLSIV